MIKTAVWWGRDHLVRAQARYHLAAGRGLTDESVQVAAFLKPPKGIRGHRPHRGRPMLCLGILLVTLGVCMVPFCTVIVGIVVAPSMLAAPPGLALAVELPPLLMLIALLAVAAIQNLRLVAAQPDSYYLFNFARAIDADAGTGARFLQALCANADFSAETIALHTTSARLVSYYRGHGFEVVRRATMPWLRSTYLMVRAPQMHQLGRVSERQDTLDAQEDIH